MYKVHRELYTSSSEKKSGFNSGDDDLEYDEFGNLRAKNSYSSILRRGKEEDGVWRSSDFSSGGGLASSSSFKYNTIGSSQINPSTLQPSPQSNSILAGGSKRDDGYTLTSQGYNIDLDFLKELHPEEYDNITRDPKYLLNHHRRLHKLQQQQFQKRSSGGYSTMTTAGVSSGIHSSQPNQSSEFFLQNLGTSLPRTTNINSTSNTHLGQQQTNQQTFQQQQNQHTFQQHHQSRIIDPTNENAVALYNKRNQGSANSSFNQRLSSGDYSTLNNAVVSNNYDGGGDVKKQEMVFVGENGSLTTKVIEEVHKTRTTIIDYDSDDERKNEIEKPSKRPTVSRPPRPKSPEDVIDQKVLVRQQLTEMEKMLKQIQPIESGGPQRTYINQPNPVEEPQDKKNRQPINEPIKPKPTNQTGDAPEKEPLQWKIERDELWKKIGLLQKENEDKEKRNRELSKIKQTKETGIGDGDVNKELQKQVIPMQQSQHPLRIHEKELNTEETTEIHEKEIKTIFVTGIDDKLNLASTNKPLIQQMPQLQQNIVKKESRTIGLGDGNVYDDGSSKFEVHEKELRTVYLGGPDAAKATTRNVGILCKAAMRDVGMVHAAEEEKANTRNVAIGAGEVGVSESDMVQYAGGETMISKKEGQVGQVGQVEQMGKMAGGKDESYFATSGFMQTSLTSVKGGLGGLRGEELKAYLDEYLKRTVHSVGSQCQFSTENKGVDATRVGYDIRNVGVSDDVVDVEVIPIREMRSVAVDNRPSLFHRCVGTELIYKLDVGTNTKSNELYFDKSINTDRTPLSHSITMTDPLKVQDIKTGTELQMFFALDQLRTTGTMTDDVDMFNKRVNTETSTDQEERIGSSNNSSSFYSTTSGAKEIRTDEEQLLGYKRYVEETVSPGYLVNYTKTTRKHNKPEKTSSSSRKMTGDSSYSSTSYQTKSDQTVRGKNERNVTFSTDTQDMTRDLLGLNVSNSVSESDGTKKVVTETRGPGYSQTVVRETYSSSDGGMGIPLVPGVAGFPDDYFESKNKRNRALQSSTISSSSSHSKTSKTHGTPYYSEKVTRVSGGGSQLNRGLGESQIYKTSSLEGGQYTTEVQYPAYKTTKLILEADGGRIGSNMDFEGNEIDNVVNSFTSNRKTLSSSSYSGGETVADGDGVTIYFSGGDGDTSFDLHSNDSKMGVKTVVKESYGQNNIKTITTEKIDMATGKVLSTNTTQAHYDQLPDFSSHQGFAKKAFTFAKGGIMSEKFSPDEEFSLACQTFLKWSKNQHSVNKKDLDTCFGILLKRWFHLAGTTDSNVYMVEGLLGYLADLSPKLVEHVINSTDSNGNTVLHYAATYKKYDLIELLLNTKLCDLNKQNKVGYTPCMLTVMTGEVDEFNIELLRRLFDSSNLNIKSNGNLGNTVLMWAVGNNKEQMVRLLLDTKKCDVNVRDKNSKTALMISALKGDYDVVKMLLTVPNIDVYAIDQNKKSALDIARESKHQFVVSLLEAHLRELGKK